MCPYYIKPNWLIRLMNNHLYAILFWKYNQNLPKIRQMRDGLVQIQQKHCLLMINNKVINCLLKLKEHVKDSAYLKQWSSNFWKYCAWLSQVVYHIVMENWPYLTTKYHFSLPGPFCLFYWMWVMNGDIQNSEN